MRVLVVACCVLVATHGEEENALFDRLAKRFGVRSRVELYTPPGRERGIYATETINEGEPVLEVPFQLALLSPVELDLEAPWDVQEHNAPDTLLARQLLTALYDDDAVASAQVSAEQRDFWQAWSALLPKMAALSQLVALPHHLLPELQDEALMEVAKKQRERVDVLLGDMLAVRAETDIESVRQLRQWAVAICSSRPFIASVSEGKLAALVPFIDMANHDDSPNCEVQSHPDMEAVYLIAKRSLLPGEEVTHSYNDDSPNRWKFSQFGYVPEDNPHDRLELPHNMPTLSAEAMMETTFMHEGQWEKTAPLLEAVLGSLPLVPGPSNGSQAEVAAAAGIEQWLHETASRDFSTSLADDEVELATLSARQVGNTGVGETAALGKILHYRIQRKRLWHVALELLEAHKLVHRQTRAKFVDEEL